MTKSRVSIAAALAAIIFAAGIWGGILLNRYLGSPALADPEFRLITQAWDATRKNYVDRNALQPRDLAYDAIDGMIDGLGDTGHSRFLTPEEVKRQESFQRGQIEGVGILVQERNGLVVIVAPIDDSPAQKAGLRPGDVVIGVDGQQVTGVADAVRRILGPAGTHVTLTILSPSGGTREVPLVRARIDVKSATWRMVPGTTVAHIRLASFAQGTKEGLAAALEAARAQGATGLVLDLRDNPGGLLDQAVSVTGYFLQSGNALLERDADGNTRPVPVEAAPSVSDLPLVALVNGGTASAAEIVAGALQDAGRAKLVGERTFGTGTVLTQFPLADGSALLLAIQEWMTPSGRTIWHKGLDPDFAVGLAANAVPVYPSAEEAMTRDQLDKSGDQQLLKALSLLGVQ